MTRYPNILAEVEAYTGWLYLAADFAEVSTEIMAAVVEDGEKLTLSELLGLSRFYGRKIGFLMSRTLQLVDPTTNKGKYRLRQLSDLLKQADDVEAIRKYSAERVRDALERGDPVTFAAWQRGCQEIREELDRRKPIKRRSTRIEKGITA